MNPVITDFDAVLKRWRIWFMMANQDIGLRYRRSILGPFWISLAMASLVLGLGLLYSQIFHIPFRDYLCYIAAGLLAWYFISASITDGCGIVTEAESHLRSLPVPITIFAARTSYRNLIIFAHNAAVVAIILIILRGGLSPLILLALPALVAYALFGFFIAIILGPLSTRYRDIPQVVATSVQLVFFLTPIFWQPSQLRPGSGVILYNPFYHFIEIMRSPFLGHWPSTTSWIIVVAIIIVSMLGAFISDAYSRSRLFLWL